MGVNGSYRVLSPIVWESSAQKPPEESPSAGGSKSKQQKVVELVKKWLLCGGWMFDSSSTEYDPVISPGKPRSSSTGVGADGYVKPPTWKLFLRRVRARSKKVQNACCEGLCFHPQKQPLNYCSTDSYERNFDKGREYWEDHINLRSSVSASAAAYSGNLHHSNSVTPILWENKSLDSFFVASSPAPIWGRTEQIAVAAR